MDAIHEGYFMSAIKRKAPIAANNQGGIVKTSKSNYRIVRLNFHPNSAVFATIFKQANNGGVNHASC